MLKVQTVQNLPIVQNDWSTRGRGMRVGLRTVSTEAGEHGFCCAWLKPQDLFILKASYAGGSHDESFSLEGYSGYSTEKGSEHRYLGVGLFWLQDT